MLTDVAVSFGGEVTTIVPSVPRNPTPCIDPEDPNAIQGICVFGDESHTVRGTDISGFTVSGFSGFGVLLLMADNSSVSNTEASHNDEYGISGFVLSGVDFLGDTAHGPMGMEWGGQSHENGERQMHCGRPEGARSSDREVDRATGHGVSRGHRG